MVQVRLTNYTAFDAPLDYHQQVALFLQWAGSDLPQRAEPLLAELRLHHPQYSAQLAQTISALGERLVAEGRGHADAVSYLHEHRRFLAETEARLSGTPVQQFAQWVSELPAWLQVRPTPIAGIFGALRQALDSYEHDLYSADQTLRDFEQLVWEAINDPATLKVRVGWSGNPFADVAADVVNTLADDSGLNEAIQLALDFVRAHEGELRQLIDTVRQGVESVVLPLADGQKLQDLIDFVAAFQQAYEQHVQGPFVPTTQTLVASYTPPPDQMSYHDSLASVHQQQGLTYEALGGLVTQLQQLQVQNEALSGLQLAAVGLVVGLVALMVTWLAVVPLPLTGPGAVADGASLGGTVGGIGAVWAEIQAGFAAIGVILDSAPAWSWMLAAGIALTAADIASSTTTVTTSHPMSITLIGGGASQGGQTVVVNGDGTAADTGGLAIDVQQDWAWTAARACAKARDDYIKRTGKRDINFAEGFLSLNGALPPETYGPILGTGLNANTTHSEEKIVNYWSNQRIPQLRPGMKPGSHLILLIFTRVQMCGDCQAKMPQWNAQLAAAAGPGVTIHFYVWQSIDPTAPVVPGNVEQVPGI